MTPGRLPLAPVPAEEYQIWLSRLRRLRKDLAAATPRKKTASHAQIAERAERIWMERGRRPGTQEEDWLAAEAQLDRERNSLPQAVRDIETALGSQAVTVTFGGNQKAGKSTLANGAMGRTVLAVDDLPETGVICQVSPGDCDEAMVVWDVDGLSIERISCTPDALRELTALQPKDVRRHNAVLPERLEVTLSGTRIPTGTRWIDLPGLDDTPETSARARRGIDSGDVLVFVSSSRQFLSEGETVCLAEHVARHGPASVLIVINAFLRGATTETWEAFRRRNLKAMLARAREREAQMGFTDEVPLAVHTVVASALMAGNPAPYTGAELIEELLALTCPDHPRVRRTRLYRAAERLKWIAERIETRRNALHDVLEDQRSRAAAVDRFRDQVHRLVRALVELVSRRVIEAGAAVEASVTDSWDALTISATCRYDRALAAAAAAAVDEGMASFLEKLQRSARDSGQDALPEHVRGTIRKELSKITFDVRGGADISKVAEGVELATAVATGAAGVLLGAFTIGLGTLVVAGVAAAASHTARQGAQREAAVHTRSNILSSIRSETSRVSRDLLGLQGELVQQVLLHACLRTNGRCGPDPGQVAEFEALGRLLTEARALERAARRFALYGGHK